MSEKRISRTKIVDKDPKAPVVAVVKTKIETAPPKVVMIKHSDSTGS